MLDINTNLIAGLSGEWWWFCQSDIKVGSLDLLGLTIVCCWQKLGHGQLPSSHRAELCCNVSNVNIKDMICTRITFFRVNILDQIPAASLDLREAFGEIIFLDWPVPPEFLNASTRGLSELWEVRVIRPQVTVRGRIDRDVTHGVWQGFINTLLLIPAAVICNKNLFSQKCKLQFQEPDREK